MAVSPQHIEKFDLKKVHDAFESCIDGTDDVLIESYLIGYKELNKFFHLMGSVFGFVSNEIDSKIKILEELMKKEESSGSDAYLKSIRTMVKYEIQYDLLRRSDYVSGSRTLLRLHRGLDFIRLFLKSLYELRDSDRTSGACQEAYSQTLAKHHTWIIRKGANMAMYAMPIREHLLKKICDNDAQEIQKTLDTLPKMLEAANEVFTRTDAVYVEFSLHDLP